MLKYDGAAWIFSSIVAVASTIFAFDWLETTYNKLFLSLPGSVFSVLGFVITAIAVIVSLKNIGLMQHIFKYQRSWWNKLVRQFFFTSKVLALFGFCLVIFSGTTFSQCHRLYLCFVVERGYYMAFMFLLLFSSLHVLKCVLVLEAVVELSSEG